MRGVIYNLISGSAILSLALLGACTTGGGGGGGSGQIVADFEFNGGAGLDFDVVAGEDSRVQVSGSLTLTGPDGQPVEIGGGTIKLLPGAISVTLNDGAGKAMPTLQAGEPININVWVDSPGGAAQDFCAGGDQYGPFTVALDENFVPVSVDPDEVTLADNTVNLINGGAFDLCLQVNWTMDARITIDALQFSVR